MPVRYRGERVFVDLAWQGPRMFSLNRLPQTVPGYRGVYVISSRKMMYGYPRGKSSLAYLGMGRVADRLSAHVGRSEGLIELLVDEGTMWFWYASASHGTHPCVESVLLQEFASRHGGLPLLNKAWPTPSEDCGGIVVRHYNLSFPYDFSRGDFP